MDVPPFVVVEEEPRQLEEVVVQGGPDEYVDTVGVPQTDLAPLSSDLRPDQSTVDGTCGT